MTPILLPQGLWIDGMRYQEAGLRPLSGADEGFLAEAGAGLPPVWQTSMLLQRCLLYLGPLREIGMETVRTLTVGDREALLLHLRRLTFGGRMPCVLNCPDPGCGEKMDLDLEVDELLVPPLEDGRPWHEIRVQEEGGSYRIRFRLPTGGDQEVSLDLAASDPQAAAVLLARLCIDRVESTTESGGLLDDWPETVTRAVSQRMAELDPQAEIVLNLTCPACGREFTTLFDTAAYFFRELAAHGRQLYRDVHHLAFHYHWSEADILGMTPGKRRMYLELLSEALTEGGGG